MEKHPRAPSRLVDEGISSGEFSTEAEAVSRGDFSQATGQISSYVQSRRGVSLRLLPSRGVPLLLPSFPFFLFVGVLNDRGWSSAFQCDAW